MATGGRRNSRESRATLQQHQHQHQHRRPPWLRGARGSDGGASSSSSSSSSPARLAGALALLWASCLCYWNSLRGEFVHDDVWAILNNRDVRPGTPLASAFADDFWGKGMGEEASHKSYRPLCVLSFKLNIMLAGMNPFYFHAVNVVLHCLVTLVLMYTCDKAVFKDCRLAFVTALFFAVHPIHTEAVTGIVGRADVLACLLFLLAFLSYNRSVDQLYVGEHFPPTASVSFLLLSLFLGTCAMLVKETGITVFGVCLVYDGFLLSQNRPKFKNGGMPYKLPRQPSTSLPASLQFPSSSRENGRHRVAHKGTWNSCHPASPEERQHSSLSVLSKAVVAVLSYMTTSNKQRFLHITRPFFKEGCLGTYICDPTFVFSSLDNGRFHASIFRTGQSSFLLAISPYKDPCVLLQIISRILTLPKCCRRMLLMPFIKSNSFSFRYLQLKLLQFAAFPILRTALNQVCLTRHFIIML